MDYNSLLPYVNNRAIGWVVRNGLAIHSRNRIAKITPNGYHEDLGNGLLRANLWVNNQVGDAFKENVEPVVSLAHAWDMEFANKYAPAWNLGFDTYSSQPDETSGIDTWLNNGAQTSNYGNGIYINTGRESGTNDIQRAVIKFDLSSIPSTAVPSASTFSAWTYSDSSNNTRNKSLFRCLKDWIESQATWNVYQTSTSWSSTGCSDSTNDYDGANVWATTSMSSSESLNTEFQWVLTSTGLTELRKWIDGTNSNYGWLFKTETESQDRYGFHSSNSATAGYRPKLVITYLSSSGTQMILI